MAKEINLFDTDIETAEAPHKVKNPSGQDTLHQPSFPGILENIETARRQHQQEKFIRQHARRIIEALLFASSDPVPFNKFREVVDTFQPLKPRIIRDLIVELQTEYVSQQRAFRIEEIADGFLLVRHL